MKYFMEYIKRNNLGAELINNCITILFITAVICALIKLVSTWPVIYCVTVATAIIVSLFLTFMFYLDYREWKTFYIGGE